MAMKKSIELKRQSLQNLLDSQKTQKERNMMGQYSTPKKLVDSIVKTALSYINGKIRFLDTSIGTGVFFSSLLDLSNRKNILEADGYEIDNHYAIPARKLWKNENINYVIGDFLDSEPPKTNSKKYNLIISNPPYIRHHFIASDKKRELKERINMLFDLSFSGLTSLYGYFMAISALWLQDNGISVWLVPNEFLDVNYGIGIKSFLLNKVKLLRIHKFDPLNKQFSDALITSTVVFYSTGQTSDVVSFTAGNDLINPDTQILISPKNLNPSDKWSNYFSKKQTKRDNISTIGEYFYVKRGIATGSNKHFILSDETISRYKIPFEYLTPILPSPKYIEDDIIEFGIDGCINGTKKLRLLNIPCSENKNMNLPDNLLNYLNDIYIEIKDNYIIRNRSPWFKQEYRPECPLLLTYMGRNVNKPFRLFLNKTNAAVPNVYLMLYPKFDWKKAETQNVGFLKELHDKLQNINSENFISSGRVYGGGLYKIEPKELMNVSLNNILSNDIIGIIKNNFLIRL